MNKIHSRRFRKPGGVRRSAPGRLLGLACGATVIALTWLGSPTAAAVAASPSAAGATSALATAHFQHLGMT
jgi:hypothetical protein